MSIFLAQDKTKNFLFIEPCDKIVQKRQGKNHARSAYYRPQMSENTRKSRRLGRYPASGHKI